MKTRVMVAVGFMALLATILGSAHAAELTRVNIPFSFIINGKTLPAGEYDFSRIDSDKAIQIVSVKKGPNIDTLVVTRLGGAIHGTPADAHVVFDKVGDIYYLSEFWIPGMDGFLLHVTSETHEHRTINIPS